MPSAASIGVRSFWARNRGLIVPALLATSILVIIVPLPAALLDLLLAEAGEAQAANVESGELVARDAQGRSRFRQAQHRKELVADPFR